MVILSAVGSGANDASGKAPKLIATLDGGATVCAYRADTPAIPVTAATVGDEPIKSAVEDGADVDAAPPPEPPVLSIQVKITFSHKKHQAICLSLFLVYEICW